MFKVGDKIVYPMHGAGTIEKIESREILGEIKDYYILNIACGTIGLMLPVDTCEKIGVRSIVSNDELNAAIFILGQESTKMADNWNKRQRENTDKLKTGDINLVAEIVRNLTRNNRERKLSAGEKKLLTNAKRILTSEIMLIRDVDEDVAMGIIEDAI